MKEEAAAFWERAQVTLRTAESLIESDPDSATSRAYYAALNAVSALFALEGKTFSSNGGVEGAVHRDLVRTKRYPDLGTRYSSLSDLRSRLTTAFTFTSKKLMRAAPWPMHAPSATC